MPQSRDPNYREIYTMQDHDGNVYAWDIAAAIGLVADREPNLRLDVLAHFKKNNMPRIIRSRKYALGPEVDLSQPVIAVPTECGPLIIDGWHRIYKAKKRAVFHLPAHLLTIAEEHALRLNPRELAVIANDARGHAISQEMGLTPLSE